ncbi:hypothetical protein ACP4OV_022840 [Aristida adscensionis]
MATAARRGGGGGGGRRPFAVLASPAPARGGGVIAENVAPGGTPSLAQRPGKCAGESTEAAFLGGGGKAGKKCGATPASVSKKPAAVAAAAVRTPRTPSRRRLGSCSKKCSTPRVKAAAAAAAAAAKAGYDAPRAPLWDISEERSGRVRAMPSSPADEAEQGRRERRRGGGEASSRMRTTRSVAMEEAMAVLPEPGEGRVKYLVDTFERLLSLAAAGGGGPDARRRRKDEAAASATTATTASASPSTPPPAAEEIDVSYPSVASSSEVSFPGVACILDASDRTRISDARRQRRQRKCSSTGSSERGRVRKVTRVTSQQPFNLRTEQRGKVKEHNFVQSMRKMQLEEEGLRNPLAQGLPYTTDEPEIPVKPPLKEPTEPIDIVLHSYVRAVDRANFDHHVAERLSFLEKVKLARERQQKLDEEIEIKQLRKEQVPRAHPMPDFTKPFVPKRSVKPQTIPREPKFQPRLMRQNSKA